MRTLRGVVVLRVALVCAAAVGAPSHSVSAQDDEAERVAGRGFFQAGYTRLDMDELNQAFGAAGLPSLDQDYLTLGGAGLGSKGRFLIGGEGHALVGGRKPHPAAHVRSPRAADMASSGSAISL